MQNKNCHIWQDSETSMRKEKREARSKKLGTTTCASQSSPQIRECHSLKNAIMAVHTSTMPDVQPIKLILPPQVAPQPLSAYIWEPFNVMTYSLSFAPDNQAFDSRLAISKPDPLLLPPDRLGSNKQKEPLVGALVINIGELCLEVDICPNPNLFKSLFGIEFVCEAIWGYPLFQPLW